MFNRLIKCMSYRSHIRLQPPPHLFNTKTIYRHNIYSDNPTMLRNFSSITSKSTPIEISTLPKPPNRHLEYVSNEFLARWIQLFEDNKDLQTVSNAKLILSVCGRAAAALEEHKRQQLAEIVFKLAPKTEELYNIYLKSCIENKHAFQPAQILNDMETNSLQPNVTTMGLIFEQYCALGETEKAVEVYKENKHLPVGLLAHLAWGYSLNGLSEKIHEVINNIKTRNVSLSWPLLSIVCRSLVKNGDTQQGISMFRDQVSNREEKVPIQYLTLFLEELAVQGKISEAKDLVSDYVFNVNDLVHLSFFLKKIPGGMDILFHVYVNLAKDRLPQRHLYAMLQHLLIVHNNRDDLFSAIEKLSRLHPNIKALSIEIAVALNSPHAVSLLQDYRSNEEKFSVQMLLPFIINGQAEHVVQTNDLPQLLDFIYDFLGAEKDSLGQWLVYLFLFKHDVLNVFDWGSEFDPSTISPHQIDLRKSFQHPLFGSYAQENYGEIFKTTPAISQHKVFNALISTWLSTGDLTSALGLITKTKGRMLTERNAIFIVDECVGQGVKIPEGVVDCVPTSLGKLALLLNADPLDVDTIIKTSVTLLQHVRLPPKIYSKCLSLFSLQKYSIYLGSGIQLNKFADYNLFFGVMKQALENSGTSEIVDFIVATCFSKDGMKEETFLMVEDFYHFCRKFHQFELLKQIHCLVNNARLQSLYNTILCYEGVLNGRWLFAENTTALYHRQILKTCLWVVDNEEHADKLLKLSLEQGDTYSFESVLGNLIVQGYELKEIRKIVRKRLNYEAVCRLLPLTYRAAFNDRSVVCADTTLRQLYRYQSNLNIRLNFFLYRQMLFLMSNTDKQNRTALLQYADKWFRKYGDNNFPETIELRDILTEATSTNDFSKVEQKQSQYNKPKKYGRLRSVGPLFASAQE